MRHGRFLSSSLIVAILAVAACGDGDNNVGVVVSEIDFGATDCGTTAIPRVLTITNNSPNSFNFTTSLALGAESPYEVIPPIGAVLARSQVTVMIYSKPIPAASALTENLYGDTLTVTTDKDGDATHTVEIKQMARGAVLTASMETINVATPTQLGTSASVAVMITNTGNASATLDALASYRSVSLEPAGLVVAPGATVAATLKYSPAANVAETQTLTLRSSTGATCGASGAITVTGTGTAKGLAAQAVAGLLHSKPRYTGDAVTLCVRTTTGTVACGGANVNGMRGAANDFIEQLQLASGKGQSGLGGGLTTLDIVNVVQTQNGYLSNVTDVVGGNGFYCALTMNGDEWCWGDYKGLGHRVDEPMRTNSYAAKVATSVRAISAGYLYRCTVKEPNGFLSCRTGFTGDSFPNPQSWTDTGVTAVDNNGGGAYAIKTDGTVVTFGFNNSGERGVPSVTSTGAVAIPAFSDAAQIVTGGHGPARSNRFACVRKTDSTVWCWGDNRHGQLGDGTQTNNSTPVQVIGTDDLPITATQISAGRSHVCALSGSNVLCWGRGSEGQIGSGNQSQNVLKAETVTPTLTGVANLEGSHTRSTCASMTNGALRCWGQYSGFNYVAPEPVFAFEP